jgi:hypothetical protein
MTDEDVKHAPCEQCGGECENTGIGYSLPATFFMKCRQCGREFSRSGIEGIRVISEEEYARRNPTDRV